MKDPALLMPGYVDRCHHCKRGVFAGGLCSYCGRTNQEGDLEHVLCHRRFATIEQFNAHVCGQCPAMLELPKSVGRPRKHSDDNARKRAYRARTRRRSAT